MKYVGVSVRRNKRGRVIRNSGLKYFNSKRKLRQFLIKEEKAGRESHIVNIKNPTSPELDEKKPGYWCPYCCNWEIWVSNEQGNKCCPICRMSDHDYYVKQYNNLWYIGMSNKKMQKLKGGRK